ncbi:site-specific integrase [Azospirillum endophyticum]
MTVVSRAGRHTAQVRYKGISIAQTFDSVTAARRWEGRVRAAVDEGRWPDRDLVPHHLWDKWGLTQETAPAVDDSRPHLGWTLDRALTLYERQVTSGKKGWKAETDRLASWRRHPVASRRLDDTDLTRELQSHVGARLAAGRAATTVRNEIFLLSAVYEHAREKDRDGTGAHGWGISDLHNPTRDVVLPAQPGPRRRRLQDGHDNQKGEEERLLAALAEGLDPAEMLTLYRLAVCTGMRKSEILDIRRGQIRRSRGVTTILRPDSKNGHAREVVLSSAAVEALTAYMSARPSATTADERLFTLNSPAVHHRWRTARAKAQVTGLHFHDLRHEGLSRMADAGLTLGELQSQSGQRTTQVLAGYLNAKASDVARKLG